MVNLGSREIMVSMRQVKVEQSYFICVWYVGGGLYCFVRDESGVTMMTLIRVTYAPPKPRSECSSPLFLSADA